jgi:hypothetical protein
MAADPTTIPVHYSRLVSDKAFWSGRIRLRPRTNFIVPDIQWQDRDAGIVEAVMGIHLNSFKGRRHQALMLLDEGVGHFTEAEVMAARLIARVREWILDEDESGLYIPPGRYDYHTSRFLRFVSIWLSLELTPRELKKLPCASGKDAPVWRPNNGRVSTKYRI